MVLFWAIAALMTAVAVALLVRPLWQGRTGQLAAADYDLAVYRDQLAEVDRDVARGVLTADQAAAARLEIERRILGAGDAATGSPLMPTSSPARSKPRRGLAIAVAIGLPLAALALYLALGHPELSSPTGSSDMAGTGNGQQQPSMDTLASQLAARLAANPDDVKGWELLGRTYALLGRFKESADAYAQGIAHGAKDARAQSAYGESLTLAANGQVTVAALQAFEAALGIDSQDPLARYYQAMARSQAGKKQEALDLWVKLEADSPAGAQWLPLVETRIKETAAALNIDPATIPGRRPPAAPAAGGPTAADMQAAGSMTPEQRTAFIRNMVDGLAQRLKTQPNDLAGWQQLAQSYGVLDDRVGARDAWAKAAALAPTDFDTQSSYAEAMLGTQAVGDKSLPPGFPDVVKRMQALRPKSYITLFYGGLVEKANGNIAGARAYWQELLATLPADLPIRAQVQRNLDELGNGG